jgi:RNase P/RNase MRP subunit POP5
MPEISRDELKQVIKEALEEYSELTFGVNSTDPEERDSVRDDMKFLRRLRTASSAGGEKIFLVIVGVTGTVILSWVIRNIWPDGEKYLK